MRQRTHTLHHGHTVQLLRHTHRPQQCLPQEQAPVYLQGQSATKRIMPHTKPTAPTNREPGLYHNRLQMKINIYRQIQTRNKDNKQPKTQPQLHIDQESMPPQLSH
jgi:hypothetical protein